MEDNKLSFSIDKDLLVFGIQSQLSKMVENPDKSDLITKIVQQILNTKVNNYGSRTSSTYCPTFFEYELKSKLRDITSETIKEVLNKNSTNIKALIEKEIVANLGKIAATLVQSLVDGYKTPIKVNIDIER